MLDDFIDIAEIIKHKHEDLEVDIALHILHATVDQYFDIVHEIEDDVMLFEEKHGNEKKGEDIKEDVKDTKEQVKDSAKKVGDSAKKVAEDAKEGAEKTVEEGKKQAKKTAETAKEEAKEVKKEIKK